MLGLFYGTINACFIAKSHIYFLLAFCGYSLRQAHPSPAQGAAPTPDRTLKSQPDCFKALSQFRMQEIEYNFTLCPIRVGAILKFMRRKEASDCYGNS